MKYILITLWLGLSIYSTYYLGDKVGFILPTLLLSFWVIISMLINSAIYKWTQKRFNLPKSKKYDGRKSPIYKLSKGSYDSFYSIEKYEIDYFDLEEEYFLLIPFSAFFRTWKYGHTKIMHTKVTDENLDVIGSLEQTFEGLYIIEKAKHDLEFLEKTKKKNIRKQLNKEFKENYIGQRH